MNVPLLTEPSASLLTPGKSLVGRRRITVSSTPHTLWGFVFFLKKKNPVTKWGGLFLLVLTPEAAMKDSGWRGWHRSRSQPTSPGDPALPVPTL